MSRTVSPSVERPYGLARVLRTWKIPPSGFHARRQRVRYPDPAAPGRRGPNGPCDDATLLEHIRTDLKASPWHGEGHRKVWARLRVKGIRTSKVRVRRLMRENGLPAPMRAGRAHGPKAHDRTITTQRPDEMWGTDMTATVTPAEGNAAVFVAVDHATAECVGIHAAKSGNRFEALEPIRQGLRERFGAYTAPIATGLSLRHDHSSAYLSDDFQDEPRFLGAAGSPAFVREPEGTWLPAGRTDAPSASSAPQRKLALGPILHDGRGTAPGAPGLQGPVQPYLADRTPWLQDACASSSIAVGGGRMNTAYKVSGKCWCATPPGPPSP